jgi:hypothetical protein
MRDLIGQRFGRLLVVGKSSNSNGRKPRWFALCKCGNQKEVAHDKLLYGDTKSCGCLRRETTSASFRTHGDTESVEHRCWCLMRSRCNCETDDAYADYGGRGIKVCDRWMESYENFLEDMGRKPTPLHTVDRIKVNGNYEPGNCRWATKAEQNLNRRNNRLVWHNRTIKTLKEWCDELQLDYKFIHSRITKYKMTFKEAITRPNRRASAGGVI